MPHHLIPPCREWDEIPEWEARDFEFEVIANVPIPANTQAYRCLSWWQRAIKLASKFLVALAKYFF